MKPHFHIVCSCLLFCALSSRAQLFSDYNFKFKNYTTQNGLVHNYTRKCKQDSKGFLWIITQNGLSRFDGHQFRNFQHIPGDSTSLPFNDLLDIAIDDKDRIWLAYMTGLCYYDQVTRCFYRIDSVKESSTLVFDKISQAIWYYSREEGLIKIPFNDLKKKTTKLTRSFFNIPYCMMIDSRQRLWIGTDREWTICYDIPTDTFTDTGDHNWARDFWEDKDGTIWISLWGVRIHSLDNKGITGDYLPQNDFPGLYALIHGITQADRLTGDSILWVLTHNAGLLLFNKHTKKFIKSIRYNPSVRSGLLNDYSSSIYKDRNGIIWICSWYGLSKINPQEQQFHSAELPDLKTDLYNLLSAIKDDPKDPNIAWLFVTGLGIAKYDKSKDKVIEWYDDYYRSYDWVWTVGAAQDSKGRLWTATYGGLISIDDGRLTRHEIRHEGRFTYPDGFVYTRDDNIWLWTDEGIIRFNTHTFKYTVFRNNISVNGKTPNNDFKQIQELDSNTLIVASLNGLYKFEIATGRFQLLNVPGYRNSFFCVQVIGDHAYVGGEDGLFRYHLSTGKSVRLGEKEAIISLKDGNLLKDDQNRLWIYAIDGLFCYEPKDNSFKKFTSADGIYNTSNDRSELFRYNEKIYIGYRMAYTSFDPAKVDVNNNIATPFITDIRINNTALRLQPDSFTRKSYQLPPSANNISFDFTGIDFTNSERMSFQYMLEGFDDDWINGGSRRNASYSNLRGGHYVFKVKVANSSGLWNQEPARFQFYIKPPLQQQLWFRLLVSLLFASALYLIYRLRIRQLRKKQKEKSQHQQLLIEKYKQELELEQISSFFSESLVDKNNTPEVLNEVAKNLIGKLGFDNCMIYLWNENKTKLIQTAGYGIKGEIKNPVDQDKFNITKGSGIVGAAVAEGRPVVVNDTSKDSRYFSADDMISKSELCVPLMDDREVIGAINIEQGEKDHFSNHHVRTVSAIATMVVNKLKAVESTQSLYQKEKQLAETELAMLRSQMNPHFIFNSLNSVQKYIWENKEEDAAEYLAKFAKLMRAILENSRKEFVTVREEIETMKIYTDLEHRRSNGRFDYTIRIAENVDAERTLIPPMLLQPFIENAIWHGLNKKSGKGHLNISVQQENQQLVCIVDDDGVGRSSSQETLAGKRSLGIEITRQRIERLMQSTGKKPTIIISDKVENEKPLGTKVTITLPLQTT